jgi:Ca2+-binding RTX toxin-like protein
MQPFFICDKLPRDDLSHCDFLLFCQNFVALAFGHNLIIKTKEENMSITQDTTIAPASLNYSTMTAAITVTLTGTGNDTVIGSGYGDSITGGAGKDLLSGYAGNDTLKGGDGNDTLRGGTGDDYLYGDADNDTLTDEQGNDYLSGGSGADTILGGIGNDKLYGGSENDSLSGGDDQDTLNGDSGYDTLDGGLGNDTLYGGSEPDSLLGGDGNDILNGDSGNDTLDGGLGNDLLYGGTEGDLYIHSANGGLDKIYETGGQDTLKFSGILYSQLAVANIANSKDIYISSKTDFADAIVNDGVRVVFNTNTSIESNIEIVGGSDVSGSLASLVKWSVTLL